VPPEDLLNTFEQSRMAEKYTSNL